MEGVTQQGQDQGQKQIKYKSATRSHELGFANKASRIFHRPGGRRTSSPNRQVARNSPMPQTGTGGPSVGQTSEGIGMAQIAARRASKTSRNRRRRAGSVKSWLTTAYRAAADHDCQAAPPGCLKRETGGPSVGQTMKESATGGIARVSRSKQAAIAFGRRPIESWLTAANRAGVSENGYSEKRNPAPCCIRRSGMCIGNPGGV